MSAAEKIISLSSRRVAAEGKSRMQEGFVAVPNEMFDALLAADLTGRQFKVAMAIVRKTLGYGKTEDDMTITQIAELAGIHRPDASKAFQQLLDFKVISARKGRHGQITSINHSSQWDFQPSQNATESTTNVAKHYVQPSQNATHNRQPQQTVEEPNGSLSSAKPKTAKLPCPHEQLIALYHEELPTCRQVREWNDSRKSFMRARWNEKLAAGKYTDLQTGLAYWKRLFAYINRSDFLTGRAEPASGRKQFVADLEWIIRPSNFAKIVEGKYHEEAQQ